MTAFISENLGAVALIVGGIVITIWGFLVVKGATAAPPERDDESPTNPKGKQP